MVVVVAAVAVTTAAAVALPSQRPERGVERAAPVGSVAPAAPRGLLDWPARGPAAADARVLPAAVAVWRSGAPEGERPADAASLLYAGPLDGRQVALVQALDEAGRPRVAQVVGTPPAYVGSEALPAGAAVLSVVPPRGAYGPVRVLVTPAAVPDGLLAGEVPDVVTRSAPLDADGVSGPLPADARTPASSSVVVLGRGSGGAGRPVLVRATVRADRLVARVTRAGG